VLPASFFLFFLAFAVCLFLSQDISDRLLQSAERMDTDSDINGFIKAWSLSLFGLSPSRCFSSSISTSHIPLFPSVCLAWMLTVPQPLITLSLTNSLVNLTTSRSLSFPFSFSFVLLLSFYSHFFFFFSFLSVLTRLAA
jgi:hypothetical protein